MNFELAKKLKEAGFPMRCIKIKRDFSGDAQYLEPLQPLVPSLSELIEECGDDFNCLFKHTDETFWTAGYAVSEIEAGFGWSKITKIGEGSTPEEAVANLYLELNKNVKA